MTGDDNEPMPADASDADAVAANPAGEPAVGSGVRATSRARRIGGRPNPVGPSVDQPRTEADESGPRPGKSAARVAADRQANDAAGTATTDAPPTVDLGKAPKPKKTRVAGGRPERPTAAAGPAAAGSVRWLAWTVAAVAVVAALVLGTFSVTSSHRVWWGKSSQDVTADRSEVLAAAKSCIAKLNNYDYRTLDKNEADGLACTTGEMTVQYKQAFETQIKVLAPPQKATQTFQVNDAGIERVSADRSQWDVLIFGQISTTNSTTSADSPKLSVLAAVVHMQRVGDQWLIAQYANAPSR